VVKKTRSDTLVVHRGTAAPNNSPQRTQRFDVYRNKNEKKLELIYRPRKCLALYHDSIDPQFGWMNARIQSWLPFPIQICLNGREWLARMMDQNRIIASPGLNTSIKRSGS
jgi:hypothetical protein